MPFKLHLLIVSLIMTGVIIAWSMRQKPEIAPVVQAPVIESPYTISIIHASWGMNCKYYGKSKDGDGSAYDKIHEDNVLLRVSNGCNGQVVCSVGITPDILGDDPAPECNDKNLEVEYRCFSFDKPHIAHGMSGNVQLSCEKSSVSGSHVH